MEKHRMAASAGTTTTAGKNQQLQQKQRKEMDQTGLALTVSISNHKVTLAGLLDAT
jgi:hypothetical protein